VNFRKLSECELIHAYVNIGSRIQRARVASTLPLFSEKAVNIIITYAFILGAVYFSPLPPHTHTHTFAMFLPSLMIIKCNNHMYLYIGVSDTIILQELVDSMYRDSVDMQYIYNITKNLKDGKL